LLTFCHFWDWKTFEVRNISTLFLNFEFFFLIINDDKIFFKNIMSIFVSNNFHLWIEELKDLILKIKIWKYINSYDKIEKFRKEIFSETDHFVVKQFDFTLSTIVNHLITDQINEFAQFLQSRVAKYFFELTFQQQENYRTDVKEYKRRKKQIVKIIQKMLKTNEIIRASIKFYISSKLIFIFIRKILQVLIIKYKKIND
jgi:hypothetical protein